jgi:hypothetical protein
MIVGLHYQYVDGAYLVSGRFGIAWGAMALNRDLDAAVAEIVGEQIPLLAFLNHGIEILPIFDTRLIEFPPRRLSAR